MKKTLLYAAFLLWGVITVAQVKIGGNGIPNPNAMLDVESSNKGFLPPRVELEATDQADPLTSFTAAAGITVYNIATKGSGNTAVSPGYYYNDGTKWIRLVNDAENGLHTQTGTVKLGGELTENTTIDTDNHDLAITDLDKITVNSRNDLNNQNIVLAHNTTGVLNTVDAKTFALATNTTILQAEKNGSWNLLSVIGGSGWRKIGIGTADVNLGSPLLFNNGTYTVPESGIYIVNFELQFEGGVDIGVLGGNEMAIFKNNTIVQRKLFDAVRVAISVAGLINVTLASIPVTSSNINAMIRFEKDDEVSFALTNSLLNVGLLNNAKVSIYLYKVSD